ncbi:MAG: MBL fold metallo-hydrolase, partial [Amphiplicatus sp.]
MRRLALGFASLFACMSAHAQTIDVTLLGTGDPTPRSDRFGPSTLVQAGGRTLLFDAGRGVMQRLYSLDISTAEIDGIFLTHLHSDHVVGLVDLLMTGWVVDGRTAPLTVYGPVGTRAMMEALADAFSFDIAIRSDEAKRNPEGVRVDVIEIEEPFAWEAGGVHVSGFLVDHGPVRPAFGFRVDFANMAVAMSGDTRFSQALIEQAAGVDVLIHEVAEAPQRFKEERPSLPRLAHHTQAYDAGRVFSAAKPKL